MSKLTLITEGEKFVIVTRRFDASPQAVYRAHMDPKVIQQWMLGPEGWTMPVCINEAKPGGKIRYEWSDGKGGGFFLTGEIIEVDAPHRIVHVERMHVPDPTPDNHIVTTFTADGSGTLMTMRMTLPDAATRKAMLKTGMEHGMEASYVRLERVTLSKGPNGDAGNTTRATVHISIDVPNLEHGVRFYGSVFGFVETSRPFSTMAILDGNNVTVCMHEKAAGTNSSPIGSDARRYERHWTPVHLDIHVHDLDAVLTKARTAGAVVEREFRNQGPKQVAFCSDPFGNGFCVIGEAANET